MNTKNILIQSIRHKKLILLFIILLFCISILCFLLFTFFRNFIQKKDFEDSTLKIADLNQKQIFFLDRIYLFSSANAISHEQKKALWDLDIAQYTDIALYFKINQSIPQDERKIKNLNIGSIHFDGPEDGSPNLYYKNKEDFGKFVIQEENKINNSLSFNIVDSINQSDSEIPTIDSDLLSPITFSYINSTIRKNHIITDISQPLIFDGSILKRASIPLSSLSCTLSFNISLTNELDQIFLATISIDVPLRNTQSTIYDGNIICDLSNQNILFHRIS